MQNYADLMFKDAVAELQRAEGTFEKYQAAYKHRTPEALTDDDIAFINARDSFYMATITSDGWPYVQHRGGTRGFVKVAGPNRLAVPDYHGNRQFISMGNLKTTRRMSLFFMDYLNHARLKVQGEATLVPVEEADPELLKIAATAEPRTERLLVIDVVARDWNCPKYIPTLYPEAVLQQIVGPKIAELKAENETLKAELARFKADAE